MSEPMMSASHEEHHGALVWVDIEMDKMRRQRCLCLRCRYDSSTCAMAGELFNLCQQEDLALAVTRCPDWTP